VSRLNELRSGMSAQDDFVEDVKREVNLRGASDAMNDPFHESVLDVVKREAVITPKATAAKAKWGSLIPAILGGITAIPTANALLPDHILADMGFWQYLVWTLVQAGIAGGLAFVGIYQSPPNETK
jgi:hypothetical protein